MSTIGYVNISLETFGGILSLVFILCLWAAKPKKNFLEPLYIRMLLCNTALLFCDALAWLFKGRPDTFSFFAVRITNFAAFVLGYVMLALFTQYFTSFLREKGLLISSAPLSVMYGITVLAIVLVVISQFNHMYYLIDAQNIYHRQDWFWLSQLFGLFGLFLNGGLLLRARKRLKTSEFAAFAVYICLPVIALLLQMVFYGIAVLYLATTICLLCVYISIQLERTHEAGQRELELEKSRVAIMLSQIQPHFLYNALDGIGELCLTAPERAERAVTEFSMFLRGNIESLSASGTIPFEQELVHTQHYLMLEQMRFEERLRVEYLIQTTRFSIPPLTLQPLVENAVRYGISKREDGGTVLLTTQETETAWVVTVTDDGVGCDLTQPLSADRTHVGIENVRGRLQAQCGGSLTVESTPGIGTTATISIPKLAFSPPSM